jgi:hypothetical protein|tara:strand:- start:15 stop:287 length:273 start_codon:yes stop_codon:yes gene_type:complete
MKIAGTGGAVRVGYQRAATIGKWSLTASGYQPQSSYALEAVVVSRDEYWFLESPHDLSLVMGNRQWIWKDVTVTGDDTITGELIGPPLIK